MRALFCRCLRCLSSSALKPGLSIPRTPALQACCRRSVYPLLDTAKVRHFSLCSKFRASNSAVLMKNLSKSLTLGTAHARMVLPSLNRRLHSLTSSSLLTLGITQASLVLLSLNRRLHSFIFNVGRTNSSNSFASERPIRSIIYIYIL